MARYVLKTRLMTRPRANWGDSAPPLPHPTVDERLPVDTGLVTADGHPIMRTSDQIGFIRFEEPR